MNDHMGSHGIPSDHRGPAARDPARPTRENDENDNDESENNKNDENGNTMTPHSTRAQG